MQETKTLTGHGHGHGHSCNWHTSFHALTPFNKPNLSQAHNLPVPVAGSQQFSKSFSILRHGRSYEGKQNTRAQTDTSVISQAFCQPRSDITITITNIIILYCLPKDLVLASSAYQKTPNCREWAGKKINRSVPQFCVANKKGCWLEPVRGLWTMNERAEMVRFAVRVRSLIKPSQGATTMATNHPTTHYPTDFHQCCNPLRNYPH